MPASAGRSSSSRLTRRASASQAVTVSSLLGRLENCSVSARTCLSSAGTSATSSAAVSRPPGRLDIVPPVAMSRTAGSSTGWAASTASGSSTRQSGSAIRGVRMARDPEGPAYYTESPVARCARVSQSTRCRAASSGVLP